ncbi:MULTISPECIES: LacI family DNA-binding transcriptional regulator [Paenibacillus]|uniref:Transcriptional regulator n=1 Tax=Paenibacillus naphthalenovorans TaxID=162209 RepID=A0A0U2M1Z7_9BACL|nr:MULTISPECIES: LacI family DNA-binding transcriptional regulator [Paenibacillus]ALS21216.1 transcriptional regulator [Paenibacillus naphthalenovorans]NTZ18615.1 LacI family transcriptional regulator [Paenibacillus sp. JMULE4]GCL72475.1 LacI family transcriptional regulator [Paenibacillus naphthalenovorans]SDH99823.1 DNA-binding transcriptional regulator, LacI/PurR family [Paenibacillus naphthalenovorans]
MASIREIARLANVSQSTASMVLNGKGEQYRISAVTQQRIWEAARQLNYQPNISARRLRSGGETVLPIIALFWALDTRTVLISRFLKGFQQKLLDIEGEYEMLIQPYVGTKLHEVQSLATGTRFNGAIIANPTEQDEAFLEQTQFNVPIVLYQRSSTRYSSVYVDSYKSGEEVARLFAGRGHRTVGAIVPDVSSKAIRLRKEGFLAKASELGLEAAPEHIVFSEFSEHGGYEAVRRLLSSGKEPPTALFVISDQMAVGTLSALNEFGRRVPEEIEIVGYDNDEVTQYTIPALSTVHLPVEEMAGECVSMLTDLMHHKAVGPLTKIFETHMVIRSSCGGFK